MLCDKNISRPYLSDGRAVDMVVVRPSVRLSRMYCGYPLGRKGKRFTGIISHVC